MRVISSGVVGALVNQNRVQAWITARRTFPIGRTTLTNLTLTNLDMDRA